MRVPGKEIQYAFVVGSFLHEIVYHQQSSLSWSKPLIQILWGGKSFVKLNVHLLLYVVKIGLPRPVTVMLHPRRGVHQSLGVTHKSARPGRFTTPRGAAHNSVAGVSNHPRSVTTMAYNRGEASFIRVNIVFSTAVSGQPFKVRGNPSQSRPHAKRRRVV